MIFFNLVFAPNDHQTEASLQNMLKNLLLKILKEDIRRMVLRKHMIQGLKEDLTELAESLFGLLIMSLTRRHIH